MFDLPNADFDNVESLYFPESLPLKFLPYYSVTPVARNWCFRSERFRVLTEEFKTPREAVSRPGVLFVAIAHCMHTKLSVHNHALAYYDVGAEKLHIGARPEALGIHWSEFKTFKKSRNGPDDIHRVLLFSLDSGELKDGTACESTASEYAPVMDGLNYRLHWREMNKTREERTRHADIKIAVAIMRLRYSKNYFCDDACTPAQVAAELKALQDMEDAYPSVVEYAYIEQWDELGGILGPSEVCGLLLDFHLTRIVKYFSADQALLLKTCVETPSFKLKLPRWKLPVLDAVMPAAHRALMWPDSARCGWVTVCIQLALACKEQEEDGAGCDTASVAKLRVA